jgi:hypothetical protein
MKNPAQLLEDSLLIIWNNRNSVERLQAMQQIYNQDIHFFESDSGNAIIGYEAINNLITGLQSEWAPEFSFQLSKPSQTNHYIQIASWTLGLSGEKPVASGMDVAIVENEKIKALYLYLD